MFKKIAAVSCGVFLGIVIAFARAGAFPFWTANSKHDQAQAAAAERTAQAETSSEPAPANQPEPNEAGVAIASFAPLVKRVMPSVVNVSVVQQIKPGMQSDQGGPGDSPEGPEGPDAGPGNGPSGPGDQGGPSGPFGQQQNPFDQFRRFSARFPTSTNSTGSARA
jgi:S1-C subfamily serine protease